MCNSNTQSHIITIFSSLVVSNYKGLIASGEIVRGGDGNWAEIHSKRFSSNQCNVTRMVPRIDADRIREIISG